MEFNLFFKERLKDRMTRFHANSQFVYLGLSKKLNFVIEK